jgi:hypothetical protein
MRLHLNLQCKNSAAKQPQDTAACQTRKIGDNLVVCMVEKSCPFAMPFGNLLFCKHPSFGLADNQNDSLTFK